MCGQPFGATLGHRAAGKANQKEENPMLLFANVVVAVVALLHVYFMILEMFLWDTPPMAARRSV